MFTSHTSSNKYNNSPFIRYSAKATVPYFLLITIVHVRLKNVELTFLMENAGTSEIKKVYTNHLFILNNNLQQLRIYLFVFNFNVQLMYSRCRVYENQTTNNAIKMIHIISYRSTEKYYNKHGYLSVS